MSTDTLLPAPSPMRRALTTLATANTTSAPTMTPLAKAVGIERLLQSARKTAGAPLLSSSLSASLNASFGAAKARALDENGMPVQHAAHDKPAPADCTECAVQREVIVQLKLLKAEKEREAHALKVSLVNEQEDAKQYREEYAKIQADGAALLEKYMEKCAKLKALSGSQDAIATQLAAKEAQVASLLAQADDSQARADALGADFAELFASYKSLTAAHGDLQAQLADAQIDLAACQASLAQHQAAAAAHGEAVRGHEALVHSLAETAAALDSATAALDGLFREGQTEHVDAAQLDASMEMLRLTLDQEVLVAAAVRTYSPPRKAKDTSGGGGEEEEEEGDNDDGDDNAFRLYGSPLGRLADDDGVAQQRLAEAQAEIELLRSQHVASQQHLLAAQLAAQAEIQTVAQQLDAARAALAEQARAHQDEQSAGQAKLAAALAEQARAQQHLVVTQAKLAEAQAEIRELSGRLVELSDVLATGAGASAGESDAQAVELLRGQVASLQHQLREATAAGEASAARANASIDQLRQQLDAAKLAAVTPAAAPSASVPSAAPPSEAALETASLQVALLRATVTDLQSELSAAVQRADAAELAAAESTSAAKLQAEAHQALQRGAVDAAALLAARDATIATLQADLRLALQRSAKDLARLEAQFRENDYKAKYASALARANALESLLGELTGAEADLAGVAALYDSYGSVLEQRARALNAEARAAGAREAAAALDASVREEAAAAARAAAAAAEARALAAESALAGMAALPGELAAAREALAVARAAADEREAEMTLLQELLLDTTRARDAALARAEAAHAEAAAQTLSLSAQLGERANAQLDLEACVDALQAERDGLAGEVARLRADAGETGRLREALVEAQARADHASAVAAENAALRDELACLDRLIGESRAQYNAIVAATQQLEADANAALADQAASIDTLGSELAAATEARRRAEDERDAARSGAAAEAASLGAAVRKLSLELAQAQAQLQLADEATSSAAGSAEQAAQIAVLQSALEQATAHNEELLCHVDQLERRLRDK